MEEDIGEMDFAEKAPWYVGFLIVFGFAVLALLFFFQSQSGSVAKLDKGMETSILAQRFLTSPHCFGRTANYVERSFLAVPEIGFTQKNLDSCYNIAKKSKKTAFELSFGKSEQLKTRNWDAQGKTTRRFVKTALVTDGKTSKESLAISVQNE